MRATHSIGSQTIARLFAFTVLITLLSTGNAAQQFNPPNPASLPAPLVFSPPSGTTAPSFATPQTPVDRRLDADGVPMAIGNDLYGAAPSISASMPAGQVPVPTTPQRYADLKFDAVEPPNAGGSFPANAPEQAFRAARILAFVGDEPILEGDVRPMVDPILHKNGVPKNQWDQYSERLIRPALRELITNKALSRRFFTEMVGNKPPKELLEARKKIDKKISESFFEKMVPKLLNDYEVATGVELDEKLRESGTSLLSQQAAFRDSILAQESVEKNVPRKKEILLQEYRDYYEEHSDEWNVPARARWRQITVRFKNHPSKQAAYDKIVALLNERVYGGTAFEVIARKSSEGFTAEKGGNHDWTSKGALKSVPLDTQIFAIPLGELSRPIEDEEGFHLIEILERQPARVIPLEEVQLEIKERLKSQYRSRAMKEYTDKVLSTTRIWSVWPEDVLGARPLSEITNP